jgi:putative transposase
MVLYRRNPVAGGTYFFTVALADRRCDLFTRHADLLRQSFRAACARRPFVVEAVVVLPEHLHTVWTLPDGDADFATRWTHLKSHFTRAVADRVPVTRNARGEFGLWQRRYWEHTIRDETDLAAHCDYIHFNPVKHGYVSRPGDWAWSSFRRFVEKGYYSADWGSDGMNDALETGEPL